MVKCVNTTNGIAGGPVCQGDITLGLTAGGVIDSSTGFGLEANNSSTSNGTAGLYGKQGTGSGTTVPVPMAVWADSSDGHAVVGTSSSSADYGVYGKSAGLAGTGVVGESNYIGVLGSSSGYIGMVGDSEYIGVLGNSGRGTGTSGISNTGSGVSGTSNSGPGVVGESLNNEDDGVYGKGKNGVHGVGSNVGVFGQSNTGPGVYGVSSTDAGVLGESNTGPGVYGISKSGVGSYGFSLGPGAGVVGLSVNGPGVFGLSAENAGFFIGNVDIVGSLTKSGGGFKIDHPLDPANKYLSHSFVESPDMKNVYDGVAVLDANGEARVELPEWFEALNRDFRYQLTAIGASAPNLHIAHKITHNGFTIAGGQPGLEVSWQVTGIRKDQWAQANPLTVVEEKPTNEREYYLHPRLHGQSPQQSLEWVRHPDVMQHLTEQQNRERISPLQPSGASEKPSQQTRHDEIRQRLMEHRQNRLGKIEEI